MELDTSRSSYPVQLPLAYVKPDQSSFVNQKIFTWLVLLSYQWTKLLDDWKGEWEVWWRGSVKAWAICGENWYMWLLYIVSV